MSVLENFLELLPELFDRLRWPLCVVFLVLGKTGSREQIEKKYRSDALYSFVVNSQGFHFQ
jgi:hypothetical protein